MISSNIDLTMAFVPKILQLPKAQEVLVGRSVVFPVSASGDPILRYQWFRNGSPIRGASTPRLILTETRPSDAGGYSVRISNALGEVTREPALLTVASGQMSVAYRLDRIRIPVVGDPGAGDYVQRSTDLLTWESVATVLNTGVTWEYRDGIELEAGQVFYRRLRGQ